jgi:hypothetical protein
MPHVTLTTSWCIFFNTIYTVLNLYIDLLITRQHAFPVRILLKYNTHNRNSEFSSQLFDAIYDNNFELAKNLIDGGQVDVNIKNDCGDTPCNTNYFLMYLLQHYIYSS